MASSVILRKLVPCAARVVSSRPPTAWLAPATAFPCHRDFSSSAATDNKLVEWIESEIQTNLHSHYQKEHFPFKITKQCDVIRLEREYEGDTIRVRVKMPYKKNGREYMMTEYMETEYKIFVTVKKKKKGANLDFYCTASPDKIELQSITIKKYIVDSYNRLYPRFFWGDCSESLQKTLLEYLEVRGVNTSMINFLHDKDSLDADYLARITWLNELKTAVKA